MVKPKPKRDRRKKTSPASDSSQVKNKSQYSQFVSDEDTPWRDDLPEFFKIYVPAVCSTRMRIPPEFLKKFGESIPTNVTLIMPSGMSWQVHMCRISEHWFFQKGWPEFVLENSVEEGNFLIFSYAGDSVFSVKVFTRNGCLKRIGRRSMLDEEPVEITQGEETSEPENDDRAMGRNVPPKSSAIRKFGLSNPSFSIEIKEYFMDKCCTFIPKAFWRAHMKDSTMATLWIKDKSWPVGLALTNGRLRFSAGWIKFARDNSIKHGNQCTFQLMDSIDLSLSLKVTIRR